MSDTNFGSAIESLIGGTADTFVVCGGAGVAVAQKTVAQVKTLLSLSGTNTGDQTSVSGNAGSATVLQTARTINGVSFDGSSNITVTAAGSTLSDTVPVGKGGTGLTALGSALQVLRVNAGATALEYATPSAGIGGSTGATDRAILIANGTGGATAQASSAIVNSVGKIQGVQDITAWVGTSSGCTIGFTGPSGEGGIQFGVASDCKAYRGGTRQYRIDAKLLTVGQNLADVVGAFRAAASATANVIETQSSGSVVEAAIAPGGKISTIAGISPGVVTYAVLNATTATVGLGMYRVSDRSNKYAYPDGTNWRWFNDGAIIS